MATFGVIAQRIGKFSNGIQRLGQRLQSLAVKPQSIGHRCIQMLFLGSGQIAAVGGEDAGLVITKGLGHPPDQAVACVGIQAEQGR